jgi:hypothetical protein
VTILTDTRPTTRARRAGHTPHPRWCERKTCTTAPVDGALLVTHRCDLTHRDADKLAGHTTAVLIARTDRVTPGNVTRGPVRVDVEGLADDELNPLQKVRRVLAVVDAEHVVRALTGVVLSPHMVVVERCVAARVSAGAR